MALQVDLRNDCGTFASIVGLSQRPLSVPHFAEGLAQGMVLQPIVDVGRMTALSKPDGGVRGIVTGDAESEMCSIQWMRICGLVPASASMAARRRCGMQSIVTCWRSLPAGQTPRPGCGKVQISLLRSRASKSWDTTVAGLEGGVNTGGGGEPQSAGEVAGWSQGPACATAKAVATFLLCLGTLHGADGDTLPTYEVEGGFCDDPRFGLIHHFILRQKISFCC